MEPNNFKSDVLVACKINDTRIIEQYANSNEFTPELLNSCLRVAAGHGATEVSSLLLGLGATINSRVTGGDLKNFSVGTSSTVTQNTIEVSNNKRKGHNMVVRYLLPPLHLAVSEGHFHTADYFLSQGADINFRSADGLTPMHVACMDGELDSIEYLINNKASLTLQDSKGNTPLLAAVSAGQVHVVLYLLSNFVILRDNGCYKVKILNLPQQQRVQLLKTKNGINSMTILHTCCNEDQYLMLTWIASRRKFLQVVSSGFVNETDNMGKTALHYAVEKGHMKMVKILIECLEADVNIQDFDGNTPLHIACRNKSTDLISVLLQSGAKVDIRNKKRFSQKDIAVRYSLDLNSLKKTPVITN